MRSVSFVFLATALSAGWCAWPVLAGDSSSLRAMFKHPPREYSSGPLWTWNDDLTDEQILSTLRDFHRQRVRQVWVHPRPGLMTPYLSEEWIRLWGLALDEARRLDMNVWIYDENSYPSGFAGGFVPELMPESRGRGLVMRETPAPPDAWAENLVAVFRLEDAGYACVSQAVHAGEKLPQGRYVVSEIHRSGPMPWHAGRWYVDLLYPGATQKFLEVTLEPYRKAFADELGRRIPGVFTDEPHILPAGGLPWTPDLPEAFERRWGYRLTDHLPGLRLQVGDWKRLRHNYLQLLSELFIERWARPYYEYCERLGLEFTGHHWEHEWPRCLMVPDNMAVYAWQHRPAIDILMNRYDESVHGQFGNVRAVKELSSVANQLGLKRTLCEAYGAGGWDLRFEDMKRIGDWMYVLGVNTLNEHLSYVTIRGARKRDHPQSFSYHAPWWEDYHVLADYFTRLSAALSHGEQVNRVLLIEPTTTVWMYNKEGGVEPQAYEVGNPFQALVTDLARRQVEFDLGCEEIMADHGSVDGPVLAVGQRRYDVVILPPRMENVNEKTLSLLRDYAAAGGVIWSCGEPPARVEGQASDRAAPLARSAGWVRVEPADIVEGWAGLPGRTFFIKQAPGDKGILFHMRRRMADGELLFLVNTSLEAASAGVVRSHAGSVEQWDLVTGEVMPYPSDRSGGTLELQYRLQPSGSLLLFLADAGRDAAPAGPHTSHPESQIVVRPSGPLEIRRLEPNVLTLDYVDVTAGEEMRGNQYVLRAAQFAFQKNGLDRNPWDRAVQFQDELIRRTFPPDSGFEVTYRFTIEGRVPDALAIVIERPDLHTVVCNEQPVAGVEGEWWLDKSFGRIDIRRAARVGENTVTLAASPFTMLHELEAAYVVGDFDLKPVDKGFVIVPPEPLKLGKWNEQGHPFYAGGVAYRQPFEVADAGAGVASPGRRYRVSLPAWHGSVARLRVNGRAAGAIWHPPWECDVTEHVRAGSNTIEVVVVGTLKNTLGPHHGSPVLGMAWPGMWDTAPEQEPPGSAYSSVGYGLFEAFVLRTH